MWILLCRDLYRRLYQQNKFWSGSQIPVVEITEKVSPAKLALFKGKLGRGLGALDEGQVNFHVCLPSSVLWTCVWGKVGPRERELVGNCILPPSTLYPKAV